MDRRLEDRLPVELEARVTDMAGQNLSVRGRMTDASEKGVCLMLPIGFDQGQLVRVEFADGSLFGQVVHSTADGDEFRTGIEVFEVLLGQSDLALLLERALGKAGNASGAAFVEQPSLLN